jgi:hypothetical protein
MHEVLICAILIIAFHFMLVSNTGWKGGLVESEDGQFYLLRARVSPTGEGREPMRGIYPV